MEINDENQSEGDIRNIDPKISKTVLVKWGLEKKDLRQIAAEMKLPIAQVQRILSRVQKSIIRKGS